MDPFTKRNMTDIDILFDEVSNLKRRVNDLEFENNNLKAAVAALAEGKENLAATIVRN